MQNKEASSSQPPPTTEQKKQKDEISKAWSGLNSIKQVDWNKWNDWNEEKEKECEKTYDIQSFSTFYSKDKVKIKRAFDLMEITRKFEQQKRAATEWRKIQIDKSRDAQQVLEWENALQQAASYAREEARAARGGLEPYLKHELDKFYASLDVARGKIRTNYGPWSWKHVKPVQQPQS